MPDDFAEKHRNIGYSNAVTYQMAQRAGLLYPLVGSTENYSGQSAHRINNEFGELVMQINAERNGDTNLSDPTSTVRWIKAGPARDVAVLVDRQDQKVTEVKLDSPIARQIAVAAQRVHDDEWLAGYFGTAWGGEHGDEAIPFPAANIVPAAGTGLTKAKLIAVRQMMGEKDADFDTEMPVMLLTPAAESDLLNINEYINSDFNDGRPLARGEIKPWMGFRFVRFNPDSKNAYPFGGKLTKAGNIRHLPVFQPSGLHRGVWTEFFGDIGPRRDKKVNTQIYGEARSAVTRVNEGKTFIVDIDESV